MKKAFTLLLISLAGSGVSFAQNPEARVSSPEVKEYVSFLSSRYEKLKRLSEQASKIEDVSAFKGFFIPGAQSILKEIWAYKVTFAENDFYSFANQKGDYVKQAATTLKNERIKTDQDDFEEQLSIMNSSTDTEKVY